ncbi:MAG TPA: hypothetical protein VE685_23180 [Thermoanaerobaculia bacterium]|nr:hypothetical protein [Thermoanaerobaculia bacterium]
MEPLYDTLVVGELIGEKRHLSALRLQDGTVLQAEVFFVSSPAHGRTDLARQLVMIDQHLRRQDVA